MESGKDRLDCGLKHAAMTRFYTAYLMPLLFAHNDWTIYQKNLTDYLNMIKTTYFRLLGLLILLSSVGQADAPLAVCIAHGQSVCELSHHRAGWGTAGRIGTILNGRRGIARTQLRLTGQNRLCRWPGTHGCGYPRTNGAILIHRQKPSAKYFPCKSRYTALFAPQMP